MTMIIGIDARELEGKPTGVGVYLKNILERLRIPAGARLQLYFRKQIPDSLPDIACEPVLVRSARGNLHWQQWTLWRVLNRNHVSLFFSPANAAPLHFGGIQAVTVHDLSFFRHPDWFSPKERLSRQISTALSLRQADRIYTVSSFIREELMARFRLPAERILITPNGVCAKNFDPSTRDALKKSYGLGDAKIILFVGSIFNRRHVPVLMEAAAKLDLPCVLVVIGENRTYPYQDLQALARLLGMENRIRLLDYVPDQLVQDYYRMADLFVYLSEYEGFGIPPLEAMSCGLPVVLSDTPAMNDIFRGSARFVKIDAADVKRVMQECLTDPAEEQRLREAGWLLAQRYTWDETARILSEDWEQLLGSGR